MTAFICEPLTKHHDREPFQCGIAELDAYLKQQASQDLRKRVAAVFVMVPESEPNRVVGFYTLSSASVVLGELPDDVVRRLPRYPVVPAVLLGRLARDLDFPGLGKRLLLDALARSLRHAQAVAAAVVVVDAKNDNARQFYARFDFRGLQKTPNRMFLPMKTVEKLFEKGR